MMIKIKCDQMADGWSYDACIRCRRFTAQETSCGWTNRCSLNRSSAAEKKNFDMIWVEYHLFHRGIFPKDALSTISVEYVGKGKHKEEESP